VRDVGPFLKGAPRKTLAGRLEGARQVQLFGCGANGHRPVGKLTKALALKLEFNIAISK
jgi:hypothetical protein